MTETAAEINYSRRFAFFSQTTTIHGVRELADSRGGWLVKLIWISIWIGSLAMLAIALRKQVDRYLSDPLMTRITQLAEDEPYKYPGVWFRLRGWTWMDIEKIERFNFSYEEIRYAMGFLDTNIRWESNVDPTDMEQSLRASMERANISGLGRLVPLLTLDQFDDSTEWRFLQRSIGPEGMCYYCIDLGMAKVKLFSQTFHVKLKFNYSRFYENAKRLMRFLKNRTNSDPTDDDWMNPIFFNIDTNQVVRLDPGYKLSITIDSKIYRRLRGCHREEDDDGELLYNRNVCTVDCEMRTNQSFGQSCVELDSLGAFASQSFLDGTVNVCHRGLWVNGSMVGGEAPVWNNQSAGQEHARKEALQKCRGRCLPKCERTSSVWVMQISPLPVKSGRTDTKSEFTIDFPDRSTVIIFEEVLQYDWNDMISDIGGLLGLWMGASVMSLFQIVHLCCWTGDAADKE